MFNEKDFLHKIKQEVLQHDPQAAVILFGSRARGDHKANSDWDILVLTEREADSTFQNTMRDAIYDLELEYLQPISTIIRNRQDWEDWSIMPLYKNVAKEGVAI